MNRGKPRYLMFVAILLVPFFVTPATAETGGMTVRVAKLRLRPIRDPLRPNQSLKLDARFDSEMLGWFRFDPAERKVVVEVGGVQVYPALEGSNPGVWKRKGVSERWVLRERKSGPRTGIRKLVLDVVAGRIRLSAKRMDLSAIADAGPTGIPVTLRIDDTVFTTSFDAAAKRKTYTYKAPKGGPRFPSGNVPPMGGGGSSGGSGSDPAFRWRLLDSGSNFLQSGRMAGTRIAGDLYSWQAFWSITGGQTGAPLPSVDFSREMVIIRYGSEQSTSGYSMSPLSATKVGDDGILVSYQAVSPGPKCNTIPGVTCPYFTIVVSRVEGVLTDSSKLSYQATFKTNNCP